MAKLKFWGCHAQIDGRPSLFQSLITHKYPIQLPSSFQGKFMFWHIRNYIWKETGVGDFPKAMEVHNCN